MVEGLLQPAHLAICDESWRSCKSPPSNSSDSPKLPMKTYAP